MPAYERAWATILDSNVTTLIAGLALLAFGSGPIRGFAVVHCLGILTSMFSAVFVLARPGQPLVRPQEGSCSGIVRSGDPVWKNRQPRPVEPSQRRTAAH